MYFPENRTGEISEYYVTVKNKSLAILRNIKHKSLKYQKQIELSESDQLDFLKPNKYRIDDPGSVVREMDLSFEKMCTILELQGVQQPKTLSVYEFYAKIAYFKAHNKPK